jgi:hypothetical protein
MSLLLLLRSPTGGGVTFRVYRRMVAWFTHLRR